MTDHEPLVPGFTPDPELEPLVRLIARLQSNIIGLARDGTRQEILEAQEEQAAIINLCGAKRLRNYLDPYTRVAIARKEKGLMNSPVGPSDPEWYRWFAEYSVRVTLGEVQYLGATN